MCLVLLNFLLFIDRFIVVSFGKGLETKQVDSNARKRRLNGKTKVHKIIVV